MKRRSLDKKGQATTEYILMMAVVVAVFLAIKPIIESFELNRKLMAPLQTDYARAYQYGHPTASGPDEGAPNRHPRFNGGNNFRIFINPGRR